MNQEHSSEAFFELIRRELYTAVVGDVMDLIGFRHQFLPPQIKPLRNDMIIVGRSMPVLEADVFTEAHDAASNNVMSRPFGLMLQALDDLRPDEGRFRAISHGEESCQSQPAKLINVEPGLC